MSKGNKVQETLRLNKVRISFPRLFKAEAMKDGDRPAYSGKLLMKKGDDQHKAVMAAIKTVAQAKWGKNWQKVYKELKAKDRIFITDGNNKTDDDGEIMDGYEGNWCISARSYVKPTVVDRNPEVRLAEEDGKIYSGCYVNAFVAIWAQSGEYGKRINCQLQGVQFCEDGQSFGGGRAADPGVFDSLADEFDGEDFDGDDADYDDADSGDDFDDDIPF